jgi:glycosyltransferase involved in cell wall biosynthesis
LKKVICYIQAFDCESTIEKTMMSVLNQTYSNWLCFVLANGKAYGENSFDVIKNVAQRDRRFIVLNKSKNMIDMYIMFLYKLSKQFPDSWICSLDSDDCYEPDFFERAVNLAEQNDLDLIACGTKIVLKETTTATEEKLLSERKLASGENLIIKSDDYTKMFSTYKPFFNEMWGKLYSTNLFVDKKYTIKYAQKNFFLHFLPDSLFTLDALSRTKKIGVLFGTSHIFYQFVKRSIHNATVMSNYDHMKRKRVFSTFPTFSTFSTFSTVMEFLKSHGTVDNSLYEYMQAVLCGWFDDYYFRTLIYVTDTDKLINMVYLFVFNEKFDELMRYKGSGKYNNVKDYGGRIKYIERLLDTVKLAPLKDSEWSKYGWHIAHLKYSRKKQKQIIEKLTALKVELERNE